MWQKSRRRKRVEPALQIVLLTNFFSFCRITGVRLVRNSGSLQNAVSSNKLDSSSTSSAHEHLQMKETGKDNKDNYNQALLITGICVGVVVIIFIGCFLYYKCRQAKKESEEYAQIVEERKLRYDNMGSGKGISRDGIVVPPKGLSEDELRELARQEALKRLKESGVVNPDYEIP